MQFFIDTYNLTRSSWNFGPWKKEDKDNRSWQKGKKAESLPPSLARPRVGYKFVLCASISHRTISWLRILLSVTNRPQCTMRTTHLSLAIQNEMCSLMMLQARHDYANIQANEKEAQMRHLRRNEETMCMDQRIGQVECFLARTFFIDRRHTPHFNLNKYPPPFFLCRYWFSQGSKWTYPMYTKCFKAFLSLCFPWEMLFSLLNMTLPSTWKPL